MAHIIVVGNEKGGAGKSTVSMHVATALTRMGHKVGVMDLDLRQKSLGRYLSNRKTYCDAEKLNLASPIYQNLPEVDQEKLGPISKVELDEEFFIIEDQPPTARKVDIGKGFCKKMLLDQ